MKKIFFFLFCLLFPLTIKAASIKHFEVLNGKLSVSFDSNNNYYTVYLIEGSKNIKANYTLVDSTNKVVLNEDKEKAIYTVYNGEKAIESYTFYKELVEDTPVLKEVSSISEPKEKEIPHLILYVSIPCILIILLLFKVIVIGFKK